LSFFHLSFARCFLFFRREVCPVYFRLGTSLFLSFHARVLFLLLVPWQRVVYFVLPFPNLFFCRSAFPTSTLEFLACRSRTKFPFCPPFLNFFGKGASSRSFFFFCVLIDTERKRLRPLLQHFPFRHRRPPFFLPQADPCRFVIS